MISDPRRMYSCYPPTKPFKLGQDHKFYPLADCTVVHITPHTNLEFLDYMLFTATEVCVTLKVLKERSFCVISLRSVK